MLYVDELIALMLAIGILIFILGKYSSFKKINNYKTLLWAFYFIITAFLATILEGFFLNKTFNHLEHLCYLASAISIAIWSWKLSKINGD